MFRTDSFTNEEAFVHHPGGGAKDYLHTVSAGEAKLQLHEKQFQKIVDSLRKRHQLVAIVRSEDGKTVTTEWVDRYADLEVKHSRVPTRADLAALKTIPRKSVNQFTAEDLSKTRPWAEMFYEELGAKSPFFRAWFGDWRVSDQTPVQIVTEKGAEKGDIVNTDTGWSINIGKQVFRETEAHGSEIARAGATLLPYIDEIVEAAILLDSTSSDKDVQVYGENKNKVKQSLTSFFHSMYALVRDGSGADHLARLTVEQMDDYVGEVTRRRAYILHGIQEVPVGAYPLQGRHATGTLDAYSVADLFALVKQYDTNFSPKPVDPAMINPDGTPKLVERGGVTGYINGDGQFKAADNLGTFNASDPDIRHSRRSDTLLSEEKTFRELFRKLGLTLTVGGAGYAANPEKRSSYSNTRTGGAHVFDSQDGRAYAREIAKQAGVRLKLTNDPVVGTWMIPSMDPAELAGLSPMQRWGRSENGKARIVAQRKSHRKDAYGNQ